ncbi:MAG: sporulation initiation factor Spo0A C-terminal domain-containing protein [Bacillota bacterium]
MQDKDIDEFLMLAGFKKRHRGFDYIKYAIIKFCESNYDSRVLGVSLYKELANVHGKTAKTVEKNITCAIESAYLRGDMDYMCEMGLIFDNMRGRPTNCEFIATSAVNLSLKDSFKSS